MTTEPDHQDAAWIDATAADQLDLSAPVQVRVVGPVAVEDFPARVVAAEQLPFPTPLTNTPARVLPHAPHRARAVLQAIGGTVFIGGHRGVTPGSGFALPAGQTLVVFATCEVWACTDPATLPATGVHVYTEHRDGP